MARWDPTTDGREKQPDRGPCACRGGEGGAALGVSRMQFFLFIFDYIALSYLL